MRLLARSVVLLVALAPLACPGPPPSPPPAPPIGPSEAPGTFQPEGPSAPEISADAGPSGDPSPAGPVDGGPGEPADAGPGEPPPAPPIVVDTSLALPVALPPVEEGGEPRGLSRFEDSDGVGSSFVRSELVLRIPERTALQPFLDRWGARAVQLLDGASDAPGPSTWLVRIDTARADPILLAPALEALGAQGGGLRVADEQGLRLLAAAAEVAALGLQVDLNWVGEPQSFKKRSTSEAPGSERAPSLGEYNPDAYTWPQVKLYGVGDAWHLLDYAGLLGNKVTIAVIDQGFSPTDDFPDWEAYSKNERSPIGERGVVLCNGRMVPKNDICGWHGNMAVHAAMGIPDNGFGAAGPAGPVARAILLDGLAFAPAVYGALDTAIEHGAKIVNMSFGIYVPNVLDWSTRSFQELTQKARDRGVLLFASAGNDSVDLDATETNLMAQTYKKQHFRPCENGGVICVGANEENSQSRIWYSNYGMNVDLWGPGPQWVGPDPGSEGRNVAIEGGGTSAASPWAAGVAALVWAARPDLAAGEVEAILERTAGTFNGRRVVNAFFAVSEAAGANLAPRARILDPADGANIGGHPAWAPGWTRVSFGWDDDRDSEIRVKLVSDNPDDSADFVPGTNSFDVRFMGAGPRTLTLSVTDREGLTATDSIRVEVARWNLYPQITAPVSGANVRTGDTVQFQGFAVDETGGGALPCDYLEWTSDLDGSLGRGCALFRSFSTPGTRKVTLRAADPYGFAEGSASIVVTVASPVEDAPAVQIVSPTYPPLTSIPGPQVWLLVSGWARDSGGQRVDVHWDAKWSIGDWTYWSEMRTGSSDAYSEEFYWRPPPSMGACPSGGGGYTLRIELSATSAAGKSAKDAVEVYVACE